MASEELHCVLVPLMAQGHIIPLTDFGLQLAHRGLTVTIITTPLNAIRYQPTIDHATNSSNLKIKLMSIRFPSQEAGLRQGCENQDSVTSQDVGFSKAIELMKEPVENLIGGLMPRPSCIVSTDTLFWTAEIAWKFRIPCYRFYTISCFTVACSGKIISSKIRDRCTSDTKPFLVPGIPYRIEFNWSQVKSCLPKLDIKNDKQVYPLRGYLVNSFEEMETGYFDTYKKNCKFWGIGPVSEISNKYNRGNQSSVNESDCIKWLDSMKSGSVIYACFGSQNHMTWTQLTHIGHGLQKSNKSFIWVIRKNEQLVELEAWLEKTKFEKKVKGRGLIIRGWAPQVLILSHPAIGGFLTHCGWNSTLEGVCAGVPMLTWPLRYDQFFNEKFVVNVHRIGVSIGVECPYTMVQSFVQSQRVEEAIRELMDGEDAEERRKRARALGEMANKAVAEGGSSHSNITTFIGDLMDHVKGRNQVKRSSGQDPMFKGNQVTPSSWQAPMLIGVTLLLTIWGFVKG